MISMFMLIKHMEEKKHVGVALATTLDFIKRRWLRS
jgi:hypothetical protein